MNSFFSKISVRFFFFERSPLPFLFFSWKRRTTLGPSSTKSSSMETTSPSLSSLGLPEVNTPEFYGLITLAALGPYLLTLSIYYYHFSHKNSSHPLRGPDDRPSQPHSNDWKTSILRPEGITAVVAYYLFAGLILTYCLGLNIIPPAIEDISLIPRPLPLFLYFFTFDSLMWCIHYCQHHSPWLYRNTHAVHHTIKSPSILVALTGYLPDTCLLIIFPLHVTLFLVPNGNLATIFLFSSISLVHLHLIHSEFSHSWDKVLRMIGIVNSWDHHVHHLRPRKNLAHFFVILDKLLGSYQDPLELERLKIEK